MERKVSERKAIDLIFYATRNEEPKSSFDVVESSGKNSHLKKFKNNTTTKRQEGSTSDHLNPQFSIEIVYLDMKSICKLLVIRDE